MDESRGLDEWAEIEESALNRQQCRALALFAVQLGEDAQRECRGAMMRLSYALDDAARARETLERVTAFTTDVVCLASMHGFG